MLKQFRADKKDPAWAAMVTANLGKVHQELKRVPEQKLSDLSTIYTNDHGPISGNQPIERGLDYEISLDKRDIKDPRSSDWQSTLDRMGNEEFVALLYLGYIRMVLLQVRNRILTATAMYILLLWALTGYPFLNHHPIVIGLTCLLIFMASVVIWIYSQMHRDEILRRTTETEAGYVGMAMRERG